MRPRFRNAAGLLLLAVGLCLQASARAEDAPIDDSADERSAAHARLIATEGTTAPEMGLALRDGTVRPLSDSRGHWVFLEFGYTACPYSEWVALALSQIKADLHDQPFEFIQVYTDPSWDDIDLGTQFDFVGTQARPGPDGIPGAYQVGFVPACFLINPRGRIVWATGYRTEAALRTALREKIGSGLHFPDTFTTVSPYRQRQEEALHADAAQAEPLWRALTAEQPDDLFNLLHLANRLKYKDALAFLDAQLAPLGEADTPLRWHLLEARAARAIDTAPEAVLPLYRKLLAKYPASLRLRRAVLAIETPPARFSDADLALMEGADWTDTDYFPRAVGAYALEMHGRPDAALFLVKDFTLWTRVHPAGFLARQGHADQALALAQKLDGEIVPATATRDQAFNCMWNHLAAQDWTGASQFAARHFALTPQNATGPAVRLFCALRLHNDADKAEALGILENFKTDRAPYLFAQQVQNGTAVLTPETLAPFLESPHRIAAMIWIAAVQEAAGKNDEAMATCALELGQHKPLDVHYATFTSIRAAIGKTAAAPAPVAPAASNPGS